MFATYSCMGVVDLGATKTVIGSNLVKDLLDGLTPAARQSVRRCPCPITFRFGNQGTLKSEHALAIPIHGLWLKIAVVPGSTPFLLSNTLLRAIGAVIDTSKRTIYAAKIGKTIPIQLTGKGLFLLDLNDLVDTTVSKHAAETHQVSEVTKNVPAENCTEPECPKPPSSDATHDTTSMMPPQHTTRTTTMTCPTPHNTTQSSSKSHANMTDEFFPAEKPCTEMMDPPETRSSKHTQFARSLRVPKRHGNVQPVPETEADPGAHRDREDGLQPLESQSTGRDEGRLWSGPQWQDLSRDVGESPRLDPVVHGSIREIGKRKPPEDAPLHPTDDRESRAEWNQCAADQGHSTQELDGHDQGQSHAQEGHAASSRDHLGLGCDGRGVRDLHRGGRDGSERGCPRGRQSRCLASGTSDAACGDNLVSDHHPVGKHPTQCRTGVETCPCWAHAMHAGDLDATEHDRSWKPPKLMWRESCSTN